MLHANEDVDEDGVTEQMKLSQNTTASTVDKIQGNAYRTQAWYGERGPPTHINHFF